MLKNGERKVVLFGAGNIGEILAMILNQKVAFFIDNDMSRQNTYIAGIPVVSFERGITLMRKSRGGSI